jgi:hypothetical protein
MNQDNMPADQDEAKQWQAILRDWRTLLAWEIVVTVLTVVMARHHLGLALTAAIIDLAAVAQTLQVAKARSTSSAGEMHPRAFVTTGLGAAALITVVGAIAAVATVTVL